MDSLILAIVEDDLAEASACLETSHATNVLNDVCSGKLPLAAARSREMIDLLLEKGATLNILSKWWAPGFGLGSIDSDMADYLVDRGARLTAHAAAGLGLAERLAAILDTNASLVNSKGGDGASPLHFARNVETARLLIERGADLDVRDDDHRSTPAQWLIGDRPDVVRLLLETGAAPDVFVAVGLGDMALVGEALTADPRCTSYRIGDNLGPYPGIGFEGTGGTILQWTLGFNCSPHEVAIKRGYSAIYDMLLERTPSLPKLLVACMVGDRALASSILADYPDAIEKLDTDGKSLLARACWETNRNVEAVRIMLELGFPVDEPEINHGYTPLHNAAWDGNIELVRLLVDHGHPINGKDPNHAGSPIAWCIHAATEARCGTGDYAEVVGYLLASGAEFDSSVYPVGHEGIDTVLRERLLL